VISFFSFIGVALCLLPAYVQTPKQPVSTANYFPLTLGSTWTYEVIIPQVSSGEVQIFTQEVTVIKVTKDRVGFYAALEYRENGAVTITEKYHVTQDGIRRIAGGAKASETLVPPFPLIRSPLTPEKTWSWKGKIVQKSGTGGAEAIMSVSGPEQVDVPAGKFTTLQIHCEQVLIGQLNGKPKRANLPVDYWFAPNVGLVQRKVQLPQTTVSIRLKSFKIEH